MDAVDRAQAAEERQRRQALEEHKRKMTAQEYPTNTTERYGADDFARQHDCIDCGEQIPPARVALGHKLRCVHCQEIWERKYQ